MLRLSVKEANDLAEEIETHGGNTDGLRAAIDEVDNPENTNTRVPAGTLSDEEWLEEKRRQTEITHGVDLECMICHEKFDYLLSDTCEVCWRDWMLLVKARTRPMRRWF